MMRIAANSKRAINPTPTLLLMMPPWRPPATARGGPFGIGTKRLAGVIRPRLSRRRASLGESRKRVPSADASARHPAEQAGGPVLAARAGHAWRALPWRQAHRPHLGVVRGDHRGFRPNHAPARNPEIAATARGAAGRWRLPGRGRHDRKGGGWSQQGRLGFATGCTRILTDAESILAGILFSGFLQRRKTKSSRDAWRGLMLASSKFSEMPPRPRLEAKARDDDGRPLPLGR